MPTKAIAPLALLVCTILLLGCLGIGQPANANRTGLNVTNVSSGTRAANSTLAPSNATANNSNQLWEGPPILAITAKVSYNLFRVGQTLVANLTAYNNGYLVAPSSRAFLLVRFNGLVVSDTNYSLPAIKPTESYSIPAAFTCYFPGTYSVSAAILPGSPTGPPYLGQFNPPIQVNCYGTNWTNPNLGLALSTVPSDPQVGKPMNITVTAANGANYAYPITLNVYEVHDYELGAPLLSSTIDGIAPGNSYSQTVVARPCSPTTSRAFEVIANSSNGIFPSPFLWNYTLQVNCSTPRPDLTAGVWTNRSSLQIRQVLPLNVTTSNVGTASAPKSVTTLITSDSQGNQTSLLVINVPPLDPQESYSFPFNFSCASKGIYTINATSDADKSFIESSYSNNLAVLTLNCTSPYS